MQKNFEKLLRQKVCEILNGFGVAESDIHDIDMGDIEYEIEMLADKMEDAVLYCKRQQTTIAENTTRIFSVFPACGKTWLYEHQEDYGLKILDSDSSQFSWLYTDKDEFGEPLDGYRRIRNPDFPYNYIKHIKENIGKYDCIFVSSHASVREALDKEGINFTIVYPQSSCQTEWIGRCFTRDKNGESGCGAEAMFNNWEQWIMECIETGINHKEIVLGFGEHLSDYFRC